MENILHFFWFLLPAGVSVHVDQIVERRRIFNAKLAFCMVRDERFCGLTENTILLATSVAVYILLLIIMHATQSMKYVLINYFPYISITNFTFYMAVHLLQLVQL